MKKKLLVSFSGGETSAYMAQWFWKNKHDEFDMVFVFANTGQENEETLQFIDKCSNHFGFPVIWIEAKVYHNERKSNGFKVVDFKTADRTGKVFEQIIKKHGIPNLNAPHCTRELKQIPIKAYAKSIGWDDYFTAIGIREDEADRISPKAKENKLLYPLISQSFRPMTKSKINFWWNQQPFRLDLKGYQGNCKWCWKKNIHKLYKIASENPEHFNFPVKMEQKYGEYIPESRLKLINGRGDKIELPITFFREKRSAKDILLGAKTFSKAIKDDSQNYAIQFNLFERTDLVGGESCEIYAECGS